MRQEEQIIDRSAVAKLVIYSTIMAIQTIQRVQDHIRVGRYSRSVALGTILSKIRVCYKVLKTSSVMG